MNTLQELLHLPLDQVEDISGKKTARKGILSRIRYKIANCKDEYASQAIVIDYGVNSRILIRSCDTGQWNQFIHRGC